MNYRLVAEKCKKIIGCDTGRVIKPQKTLFFVAGFKETPTRIVEHIVARGATKEELIEDCKRYRKIMEASK